MHWFILLGSLLMVAVMIFVDVIADILLRQQEYKQGLIIVPILLFQFVFGIYINLSIWYKLTNRTSIGMYISIFGAILTIVSLMVFVPIFGYIGGAHATLFTYSFMAIISYLWEKILSGSL